ncbi:hypothetical protein ATANTOWER_008919 [Ataeniobius toweri]|uniref:Uncharacterized protein n=1 Tax=Ataeniobius toweri TaxID=208326 RepID=A0ABU7BU00_9TELE|nr:hypothetical protein [Ataeniobius toweri]
MVLQPSGSLISNCQCNVAMQLQGERLKRMHGGNSRERKTHNSSKDLEYEGRQSAKPALGDKLSHFIALRCSSYYFIDDSGCKNDNKIQRLKHSIHKNKH